MTQTAGFAVTVIDLAPLLSSLKKDVVSRFPSIFS